MSPIKDSAAFGVSQAAKAGGRELTQERSE